MTNRKPLLPSSLMTSRTGRGRRPRGIVALLLVLALIFSYVAMQGKVVRVDDGDTVSIFTREGALQKVRLYGIDCPEYKQRGGREAAAFTRNAALRHTVKLSVMDRDRFERVVALVRLSDGRILNEELLRAGHAWVYRDYCLQPFCQSWIALEQEARCAKRGLWADANPQPPWHWRQQHPR